MAKFLPIDATQPDEATLQVCAEAVRSGEVIIAPTETSYLIGGDATNVDTVEKVFALKQRSRDKPLPVIAGSMEQADEAFLFSELARWLAVQFWPGPLTILLEPAPGVHVVSCGPDGTVAVRVSSSPVARGIAACSGKLLVSTSANISGDAALFGLDADDKSYAEMFAACGCILDAGKLSLGPPSTIIRVHESGVDVLRQGAISTGTISPAVEAWRQEQSW